MIKIELLNQNRHGMWVWGYAIAIGKQYVSSTNNNFTSTPDAREAVLFDSEQEATNWIDNNIP